VDGGARRAAVRAVTMACRGSGWNGVVGEAFGDVVDDGASFRVLGKQTVSTAL
jgi:hypothetical protein